MCTNKILVSKKVVSLEKKYKMMKKLLYLLSFFLIAVIVSCGDKTDSKTDTKAVETVLQSINADGCYTDKDNVALYIHTYSHLPKNYITKKEAQSLGWVSQQGNLHKVAPGKSIGGDKFGNFEGLLPKQKGRQYYECDIDYGGGKRNAKRIVFSNDGLIYYTNDHYNSFEKLY